ncbi:MAG: mechanosensitive ion channel family protein [Kangiellaceae bacterium]|nr:mechanosensitive ion channel family protein [Kangiellaceae bacterium]
MQNIIQQYLPYISDNQLIQSALIFLFAAIVASLAKFIIQRLQVISTKKTDNTVDDHILDELKRPLRISVLIIGARLAIGRSELLIEHMDIVESILLTIVIYYWFRFVINTSHYVLKYLSHSDRKAKLVQRHTLPLFDNLAAIIFYAMGVYFLLIAWEIDISAWLASAGILGLALSFAAKDTLANLFAGVFILADSPYKLGDFIVLDSGERGEVTHIGIRSTRILTRSDVEITIPNAIMGNTKITNETAGPHKKYRIRIQIACAYGEDISRVRDALSEVAAQASNIEDEPAPRVRFRTFGDSGLNFELLCWVSEPVLRGRVSDSINEAVYNKFLQEKIEIPFPQRDINIRSMPNNNIL